MCTLTIAWQVFADAPVVVAANRDETLDRPSEPPGVYAEEPRVIAPRDSEADGTWIGYNEHGVFVGVTNRWVAGTLAAERSRGLLTASALAQRSAEDAARLVERAVERDEYDGFNLVVADENAAFLLEWDGHLYVRRFEPGVHVVVNTGADDSFVIPSTRAEGAEEQAENARRLRTALRPEPGESTGAWRGRAAAALRDHDFGVCVHGDRYGTRSSSLVTLGENGAEYEFAPGPPCETEYERVESHI